MKDHNKEAKGASALECPVKSSSDGADGGDAPASSSRKQEGGIWGLIFGAGTSSSKGKKDTDEAGTDGGGVTGYNKNANDMAFSPTEKRPDQTVDMSVVRSLSGIPKSDYSPQHQANTGAMENWVYPSEQQYFNAMKRKGYNPPEKDIGAILAIHNSVNERGWEQVLEWESFRGAKAPKLKKFEGRPKDLSPKAKLLTMLGVDAPFDRHDWVVERDGGKEVRYVIDFYHVPNKPGLPVHMDVRPALDSPSAVLDRIEMQFRKTFIPDSLRQEEKGRR